MTPTKLLNAVEKLRASYWFIPAVMAASAIFLSFGMTLLDEWLGSEWLAQFKWLHTNRPEGARALLSTIAGSMITVASVTFSMTINAVSFATSQIGPRLISNFMRDRANQVTLGTFISTFLYCLLVLRTIVGEGESAATGDMQAAFVPHLSIMVALLFALASVAVLIYFIHHVPASINVSNVIARVGNDLLHRIGGLFPTMIGQGDAEGKTGVHSAFPANFYQEAKPISSTHNGYIQVLNDNALLALATDNDLIIRIQYRPGDFATKNDVLMHVYPAGRVTDDITEKCRACFAFGHERTQTQDVLFLVDELTEIIARALSPGVNDPYTAISAMDWLQSALQEMAARQIPAAKRYDDDNHVRIIAHPLNFTSFCSAIFDRTLPYVAADRNAALRSMKMLGETIFKTSHPEYRATLLQHAAILKDACQVALRHKTDQQAVEKYFADIDKALNDPDYLFSLKENTGWLGGSA